MKPVRALFTGHLLAICFALGGLLIALPHPELWSGSPHAVTVFQFGMRFSGSLHILFGAATMLAFGLRWLGRRRTLIFFGAAVAISLSSELIGTRTGWPFGNYAYTSGLGYKVLGRVPFTIPLSWFYVGFTCFLLGSLLATRFRRHRAVWSVAFGAYLLTVWDLVLDPAMASQSLPARFWVWSQSGPYFGMPVKNFVGWTLTGVLFMTVSRLLWRRAAEPREFPAWLPFGMYLVNTIFAMALSLSVGLWQPALAAILFGWLPAWLAVRSQPRSAPRSLPQTSGVSQRVMRLGSRLVARRALRMEVDGLEHLPSSGPVLLAAHHAHHLYDGLALVARVERPLHILVALDWVRSSPQRRLMEWVCGLAGWPVVLRPEALAREADASAYRPDEVEPVLRRGTRQALRLLRAGEALVVFPEGYPGVDPHYTPKHGPADFVPFQPGFARLVALAQRGGISVPIVPVGVVWQAEERRLTLRFGRPLTLDAYADLDEVVRAVEAEVHALSGSLSPEGAPADTAPMQTPEVANA